MNEAERIVSLEKRLNEVEDILDKICKKTDVCGYKGHTERGQYEEEYREHEDSPIDKIKRSFD